MNKALDHIFLEPNLLTPLQPMLFYLCLEALIFEPTLPYLQVPVVKIHKEVIFLLVLNSI